MQKEPSEEHNLKYRMKSRPLNAKIEGKKNIDIIGAAFSGKCNNAQYVIGVAHEPDEPPPKFLKPYRSEMLLYIHQFVLKIITGMKGQ